MSRMIQHNNYSYFHDNWVLKPESYNCEEVSQIKGIEINKVSLLSMDMSKFVDVSPEDIEHMYNAMWSDKLDVLRISWNQTIDPSFLSKVKAPMVSVDTSGGDISPILQFSNATKLDISSSINTGEIRSSVLLKKLKLLHIRAYKRLHANIDFAHFPNLVSFCTEFGRSKCEFKNWHLLKNLKYLEIESNFQDGDLSFLKDLTNLEYLSLSGFHHLKDLSFLKFTPKLKFLFLEGFKSLENIEQLKSLPRLEYTKFFLQKKPSIDFYLVLEGINQIRSYFLCGLSASLSKRDEKKYSIKKLERKSMGPLFIQKDLSWKYYSEMQL